MMLSPQWESRSEFYVHSGKCQVGSKYSCTCIGTGTGELVQAAAGGRQRAARTMHCIALSQIQCPQWECCGPLYAKKVVHSGN